MADEVITFRGLYGGAQQGYGLRPDLTAMAKMIGGGFPVGAIAGRREVMQVMNPRSDEYRVPHSGTFSANPITMTAGHTAMELFDEEAVARLNNLNRLAREGDHRGDRSTWRRGKRQRGRIPVPGPHDQPGADQLPRCLPNSRGGGTSRKLH